MLVNGSGNDLKLNILCHLSYLQLLLLLFVNLFFLFFFSNQTFLRPLDRESERHRDTDTDADAEEMKAYPVAGGYGILYI